MTLKRKAVLWIGAIAATTLLISQDYIINKYNEYVSVYIRKDISYSDFTPKVKKQLDCLAENVYYEARGESEEGKIAVAVVTLNRTKDKNFPSTICEVVHQKSSTVCQFSWVCEQHKRPPKEVLNEYRQLVSAVYFNYKMGYNILDEVKHAMFYHADYVNPGWNKHGKVTKIGQHIFYNRI